MSGASSMRMWRTLGNSPLTVTSLMLVDARPSLLKRELLKLEITKMVRPRRTCCWR